MNFISKLWNNIRPLSRRERMEAYLAESVDIADLERRLKKLENENLSGWV